jgi:hypothetical protein
MSHLTKILLFTAFILCTAFDASAASRHRRIVHAVRSNDSVVPLQSNACPSIPPCRTPRDDW